MTEILPQYEEDGSEKLSFFNSWRGEIPQIIENAENIGSLDTPISPTGSLIPLVVNDEQFTELLSALYVGAEFAYPEKYLQILWYLLGAVQLPVTMPEDCYNYPPYSVFIGYPLQNPYTQPDLIPTGYLMTPMTAVNEDNHDDYPSNNLGDIVVNFGAITFDADWLEDLDGQLPTITVRVEGEGTCEVRLLNQVQGGLAIITLDNPPNILDILAGIITGADNIIDVNLDNVSVPPETAMEHIYPITIEGAGEHTIYVVFCPIIDDSLIPVRFGGGFRGLELCGFGGVIEMGVTDVKWDDNEFMLMQQKLGVYEPVTDFQLFLDYIDNIDSLANYAATTADNAANDIIAMNGDISYLLTKETDHEARITTLQSEMDTVEAAAAAAQSSADSAIATNVTQQTELDDHETRITALESAVDALDARLDALENVSMWVEEWDFTTDDFGIAPLNATYTGGTGFVHTQGTGDVTLQNIQTGAQANQIDTIEVGYSFQSGVTGAPTNVPEQRLNSVSPYGKIHFTSSGGVGEGFVRFPNNPSANAELQVQDFGSYTITYIKFYGRGDNPF